jgi:hypothetical protein
MTYGSMLFRTFPIAGKQQASKAPMQTKYLPYLPRKVCVTDLENLDSADFQVSRCCRTLNMFGFGHCLFLAPSGTILRTGSSLPRKRMCSVIRN